MRLAVAAAALNRRCAEPARRAEPEPARRLYLGPLLPLPPHGPHRARAGRGLLPSEFGDQSGYSESIPEFIRRFDWLRSAKPGWHICTAPPFPPRSASTTIAARPERASRPGRRQRAHHLGTAGQALLVNTSPPPGHQADSEPPPAGRRNWSAASVRAALARTASVRAQSVRTTSVRTAPVRTVSVAAVAVAVIAVAVVLVAAARGGNPPGLGGPGNLARPSSISS